MKIKLFFWSYSLCFHALDRNVCAFVMIIRSFPLNSNLLVYIFIKINFNVGYKCLLISNGESKCWQMKIR